MLRFFLSILAPATALGLVVLSLIRVKSSEGRPPEQEQSCLRCGQRRPGDLGQFSYSVIIGKPRRNSAIRQMFQYDSPILDTESHFICDHCTRRHLTIDVLQITLMMLPYTIYRHVLLPILSSHGVSSNFLIEGFLMLFAIGGLTTAIDLSRAIKTGETPLAEIRDRIALKIRKPAIGTQYNYYTRLGTIEIKNSQQ